MGNMKGEAAVMTSVARAPRTQDMIRFNQKGGARCMRAFEVTTLFSP
jgi:hypothetical protein